jgi:hypothetical protein
MAGGTERSSLSFLDGGGKMGALMRAHDWSNSPLGDPVTWSDALKMAVGTCLSSRFPMVVWWGPQLIMLYNDAWQPILGETKHPAGLGRPGAESWPETWPIVGAQFERALQGIASWSEDLLLASDRHGFIEECYFTYSHSPLKDASGKVVGVHSVVSETTPRVLSERRLRILRDLSNATVQAATEANTVEETCQALVSLLCSKNPDVPFGLMYLADASGRARLIASAGVDAELFPSVVEGRGARRLGPRPGARRFATRNDGCLIGGTPLAWRRLARAHQAARRAGLDEGHSQRGGVGGTAARHQLTPAARRAVPGLFAAGRSAIFGIAVDLAKHRKGEARCRRQGGPDQRATA